MTAFDLGQRAAGYDAVVRMRVKFRTARAMPGVGTSLSASAQGDAALKDHSVVPETRHRVPAQA